jgi:hypothetical protein
MYVAALPVPPSPVALHSYLPKSILEALDMVSVDPFTTLTPSRYHMYVNEPETQSSAEQVSVTLPPVGITCSATGLILTVGGPRTWTLAVAVLVCVPVLSALLAVHVTDPQSKVEILKNVILLVVVKGVLGVAVTVVTWSPVLLEAEIPLVVNEMVTSGYPVAVQVTVRSPPGDWVPSVGRDAVGAAYALYNVPSSATIDLVVN